MMTTENQPAREALFRRLAGTFVDEDRANTLIGDHRSEILREAIEAARAEYLHEQTGTPEDEAYNQAVSDVAAIGALLEKK